MPELPEVQTVVASIAPHLIGRTVRAVRVHRPQVIRPEGVCLPDLLQGRQVLAVRRRGKRIILELDNGRRLFIHLGMTGRLSIDHAAPRPHTHLEIDVSDGGAARRLAFSDPRRFGGVFWLGDGAADEGLGPEPLEIAPTELHARLRRTRRPLKAALLDQALIAGLGNIYVDESLHRAGLHPLLRACRVSAARAVDLCRAIRATLRAAIRAGGSTLRDYADAGGRPGGFQAAHRVYGRAGLPCPACAAPVRRIVVAGRSTHFCPTCQPRRARRL